MKETRFKQTEIGLIPEDWEIYDINNIGILSKGAGISKNESMTGKIPAIRYGEIYTHHNNVLRNFNSWISVSVAFNSTKIKCNDLLFTASGETKEEIGKCVAYIYNYDAYAGGDIIILTPRNHHNSIFLGYLMNSQIICKQKASKGQGDAVVHITANSLSKIKCPIPDSEEQNKIASALTSIDNLLLSLDKLIEKKKLIKQGAMQELLTGKKRLPGFTGEWIEKQVKDIGNIGRGRVISQKEIKRSYQHKYPVYSSQTQNNGIMGYIDTYDFEGEYITWTTDGINAGTVFYRNGLFNCTNVCGTIKLHKDNHLFVSMRLGLETNNYVSTNLANPKLMNNVMKQIIIDLPETIEEQKAIASVLSSMDKEIESLENKKAKHEQIKQGMMQQLLTGKIRLI